MIIFHSGSIFDSKCDLLILPCDSYGGVTNWVRQEIEDNNIPYPKRKIPFGKVLFIDSYSYEKSGFVGFAASVNGSTIESNLDSIESILYEINKYCRNNSISIINIPVLGTGAGGLEFDDVIELYKRVLSNSKHEFNVYIPSQDIAALYLDDNSETTKNAMAIANPRVFISYCRKDSKIEEWVTNLATKLRQNGIDAILDKFHLKPGVDLPQWMTNEIIKAQKVLLICDKNYAERADSRNAGVGWETMIIQGDMLAQGSLNSKYIAIACDGFDKHIPIYIKSKLGLSKNEVDRDLKHLLTHLFDLDVAPEIGEIPEWIKAKMKMVVG